MTKYTYHLIDDGGVCTEWDIPFQMVVGAVFTHEFGTYKVSEHKVVGEDSLVLCERIAKA